MIDYYEVTLQPGKPVVLTDTEREYPRYTHVIYRYAVYPSRGGYIGVANETGQRELLKRYPGAVLGLIVTGANKNYEQNRFRDDVFGVQFETRKISPELSAAFVKRLGDTESMNYAAFELLRMP